MAYKNLKRRRPSKAEIKTLRSSLKRRPKLDSTGRLDQKAQDLIDFANLASWFDITALERVRRTTERISKACHDRAAQMGSLPAGASDDERRRARDTAAAMTTLILQAESGLNEAFGTIMARADERFPAGSDHPFYVRSGGQPLASYLTGMLLIPTIQKVRKVLWRLAIVAERGQTTIDLPVQVPRRRTTFKIHPSGKVEVLEDPRVTDLNDVIIDAIKRIPDVRRLRICWLRERRKGNHACGKIFWAQRSDRRECSKLHRDLRRKQKDQPAYEERRRRKAQGHRDLRTDRQVMDLAKAVADIQREVKTLSGR